MAAGLQILDLARLHERTLVTQLLPGCPPGRRSALIRKAGIFFAVAILPIEEASQAIRRVPSRSKKVIAALSRRSVELSAANLHLSLEIVQRRATEAALRRSERHSARLLERSELLQKQLRRLSRQMLSAQEEERKKISRELHDVIAQTLSGINIHLALLGQKSAANARDRARVIARTQRLVEQSMRIVGRFARVLRPAGLDDLGLIPALHAFMKEFTARTGVRSRLSASAGVEQMDGTRRTVLFRVAQEALANVARHARAARVAVSIRQLADGIRMRIQDDGRSFSVQKTLLAGGRKRLGLLGMRERLEMVGGQFAIRSAPGKGTLIVARIPFKKPPPLKLARR